MLFTLPVWAQTDSTVQQETTEAPAAAEEEERKKKIKKLDSHIHTHTYKKRRVLNVRLTRYYMGGD